VKEQALSTQLYQRRITVCQKRSRLVCSWNGNIGFDSCNGP